MCIGLHIKKSLLFSDFNKTCNFSTNFRKIFINPSSGSRIVPCRQTDGQRDLTKLTVALSNFAKATEINIDEDSKIL